MRTGIVALAGLLLAAAPAYAGNTHTWSGVYLGAHVGAAWGDAKSRDDIADWCSANDAACIAKYVGPFPFSVDGAFGGGTVGYNFQIGGLVFGPEIDVGYLDLGGSRRTDSSNPTKYQTLEVNGGTYALLGGRAGFASSNTLIYAKGGWVWYDADATQTTTNPGYVTHGTGAFDGWAFGGGVEQALGGGWSIKGEYMHFGFGEQQGDQTSVSDPPIGHVYEFSTDLDADTVKVGVNYNFGGP